MSRYWGYRCTKDGEVTDTWFNHGEHILRSCVKCYPLVKQLWQQDESGYLEVHIMAHQGVDLELWDFLREHFEHGIELYDEYGGSEPIEPGEA